MQKKKRRKASSDAQYDSGYYGPQDNPEMDYDEE